MQSIATAVEAEFDKVKGQMDGSGKDGKWGKGFLPIKELKPQKLEKEDQ